MANFKCDGVEIEVPDNIVGFIQSAVQKRDSQIEQLRKDASQGPWTIEIEGKDKSFDDPDDMYDSFKKMCDSYKKEKKDAEDTKKKLEETTSKCDSLSGQVEALKLEAETRVDSVTVVPFEALKERIKLQNKAGKYLPKTFNIDSLCDLTDRQIKEKVIEAKWKNIKNLSAKNDAEIEGMYHVATIEEPPQTDSSDLLQQALAGIQSVNDRSGNEYVKTTENAWQWINK